MDGELLARFDELVQRQGFPNRSEALRDLVRSALVAADWLDDAAQVLGIISLVYDHHQRDLVQQLLALQHDSGAEVICTTHVHLDHRYCLEVLLARGQAADVRQLAQRLHALRGIARGELSMSPVSASGSHRRRADEEPATAHTHAHQHS